MTMTTTEIVVNRETSNVIRNVGSNNNNETRSEMRRMNDEQVTMTTKKMREEEGVREEGITEGISSGERIARGMKHQETKTKI